MDTSILEEVIDPADSFELFNWQYASIKLKKFISDWDTNFGNMAKVNRSMRTIEVDIDALHQEGKLKADETLIPIRVIDSSIRAEQPRYLQYIKGATRLAIYKRDDGVEDPNKAILEDDYTQGMKYVGWEQWFLQTVDSSQLHGHGVVDIEFDTSKPLQVGINYIPYEDCIIGAMTRDIQQQPYVVIRYPITLNKLSEIASSVGFDQTIIRNLQERFKDRETEEIMLYKKYCKYQSIVYVSWFVLEAEPQNWLKKPTKLFLGIEKDIKETILEPQTVGIDPLGQPIVMSVPRETTTTVPEDITQYPIKLLRYLLTEDPQILNSKGRAFLDGPSQEGQTALFSSFVNGSVRVSNVYGSPVNPIDSGGQIEKLDLELEHGCFYNQPINFWRTEQPSFDMIRGAQTLQIQKQSESGQLASTVVNREDARKTKAEMDLAQEITSEQGSLQITNLSIFLTEIFNYAWSIVQSRALHSQIKFAFDIETQSNNLELIGQKYTLLPAGDTEVVKKKELQLKRRELWPIVSQTPLMMTFLIDMIKEELPEDSKRYESFLQADSQAQQQLQSLVPVLSEIANGQTLGDPEKQMLQQLVQQIAPKPE